MSKLSRGEKGEKKVKTILKKIKEYHKVLNDITFVTGKTEMSHQIDHILIHPHGIFVIETKNYYGEIISDTHDSFWIKIVKGKKEKISNPLKQNKSHMVVVKRLLNNKYDVIPIVVFVKNNAPYIDDNAINLNDLMLFIDSYPYQELLDKKQIDSIYKSLKEKSSDLSKKEHLENIGYLKEIKKEFRLEMEYAIENQMCPRCDSEMIINGYEYRCSKCDFKFKL